MCVSRRRLLVRFITFPALTLALPGCGEPPLAGTPLAAAPPDEPAFDPRRGPHRPLPTATGAIDRMAQEAERKGVARWIGIHAQEAVPQGKVTACYRCEEDFPSASVIKVPVMMAVHERWAEGAPKRPREVGLVRRMIQVSDNPATNALVDWLGAPTGNRWRNTPGMRPVNELVERVSRSAPGVTRMQSKLNPPNPGPVSTNRACPYELAQLMVHLSQRELRGDAAAREMLTLMRGTSADHRTRIPAGVPHPYRARVANKTGTISSVVNDMALIDGPEGKRYVLSILMEGVRNRARAEQFCRAVTAACWKQWSG